MAKYVTHVLFQFGGGAPPLPVGSVIELTEQAAALHLAQRTITAVQEPEAQLALTQEPEPAKTAEETPAPPAKTAKGK